MVSGAEDDLPLVSGVALHQPKGDLIRLTFFFLCAALAGFLFGYDIGGTAVAFTNDAFYGTDFPQLYNLTPFESSLLISLSLLGAVLGCFVIFLTGDFLSRRAELAIAGACYAGGAIIEGSSFDFWTMTIGRLCYGFGIGIGMHGAPLYIAEITPPSVRGIYVSFKEVMIVLGMLSGYAIGLASLPVLSGWRIIYFFAVIPGIVLSLSMLIAPESPRWLALRGIQTLSTVGREVWLSESRTTLARLRHLSENEVQAEFNEIINSLEAQLKEKPHVKDLITERTLRRAMIIGCGLVFLQQVTGQPTVLYYVPNIFDMLGFNSVEWSVFSSVLVAFVKLLMTGVSAMLVDRSGRRILLLVGVFMMILALAGLTLLGFIYMGANQNNPIPTYSAVMAVIAMMLFVSGYQVGFGPISWVIISEIFPLRMRSTALSVAVMVNFLTNFIVTMTYAPLLLLITAGGSFLLYGVIAIFAWFFILFFVMETKQKSLEEIEELLKGKLIVFSFRSNN